MPEHDAKTNEPTTDPAPSAEQAPPEAPRESAQNPPVPGTPALAEDEPGEPGDVAALRREAAGRRKELRAVEAERDTLRARLDDYDKREVERIAADRLADPADAWLATSLDELRGDDGALDPAKATAEIDRIAAERPHWQKTVTADLHQGARRTPAPAGPSFGASVKKAIGGGR